MTDSQAIAWIISNFPSLAISVLLLKAYQNLTQWTSRITEAEKELAQMKIKLAKMCRLHAEHHPDDALKLFAEDEN
jgi:hypothetical protein